MIIAAVGGLLVGFFIGTRARQLAVLAASVKKLAQAVRSFTIKIPKADDEGDKGDDDGDDMEKEGDDSQVLDISDFLSSTSTALDDHPDMTLNPILMYQIGKAKQEAREKKRIAMLANEGLTEEEIGERLLGNGAMGDGTQFRQNALAVLISAGARVIPISASGTDDTAAANERRRLQRTVEQYLKKDLEIDTSKTAVSSTRAPQGGRIKSAHDVAAETALVPHGGNHTKRIDSNLRVAKDARNIFREWKAQQLARGVQEVDVSDSDGEPAEIETKERRGGGVVDANDLALLRMEFEGEEEGDDDELAA